MKKFTTKLITFALIGASTIATSNTALADTHSKDKVVNLYSARKEKLIKPALDAFTKKTGITVNLVTGKADALLKQIEAEGQDTSADLFITVDAGRLQRAKDAGVLQPISSATLNKNIPASLRDKDNQWYGLSARSRVVIYNKDKVKPSDLSTYEDLASPKWKGRICIRSSGNIYNQSLLASLIANLGAEKAEAWAKGIVDNMARPPKGNDRAQMTGAAVGECDIAIANTYYYGRWQTSKKPIEREYSTKVAVFYPNQKDRGAHINVSGAGVTKHAKHKDNAVQLLEFLSGSDAQKFYAEVNHEFPVLAGTPVSPIVQGWGYPFKKDTLAINKLGENNAEAVKIFDRVGWK